VSKTKAITGFTGSVKIKVPAKGHITVSGSGLKATKRTVANAVTVTLKVTLTGRARTILRRKHKFATKAKVTFRPSGGAASIAHASLTFKAPSTKGRR
jgi:hypothetical protein